MEDEKWECNYLVIGSGVSSYFAMSELLSLEKTSTIVAVTEDHEYPYDRPPLSKEYLRDAVKRESLYFNDQNYYKKGNLKMMLGNRVTSIDPVKKLAYLGKGGNIKFDKALIATGGSPRKAGIKGEEKRGVHYLRSLSDADLIKKELSSSKSPLILGGGFIGIEIAASMAILGKKPTVVEKRSYIWGSFLEKHVSTIIREYFEKKGVSFRLEDSIREFVGEGKVESAITEKGEKIEADFVLIAAGITPNIDIALKSGIKTDNGIIVNEYLETSCKDIYASGDVANIFDPSSGRMRRVEHWNNAMYTGKLAARNMTGKREKFDFISTVWSDIFDLHLESAGYTVNSDKHLVRGKIEELSFAIIYLSDGRTEGYVAINRPEGEIAVLNEMTKRKTDITGKEDKFEDGSSNIQLMLS